MKAILVKHDQHLVWSDVADPVLQKEEVLVRVHAAALNRADLLQRQGNYPPSAGCPEWMGLEIAGEIVALGGDVPKYSSWRIGDKVCALLGGGGYAEYAAVRYDMLMPIPKGLTMVEAAAIPEAFATSYLNLFWEGHLEAGQTVFIPAGASGLSSVAIPMAKAFGARVISSVRHEDKIEFVTNLGADVVINSAKTPVEEVLREENARGNPIHVAMDCVSGEMVGTCLPYMTRGGYWIVIATLGGTETTLPLRTVLMKGLHIVGSTLRSRPITFKAALLAELVATVWPKIEDGTLRPLIHAVLPIEEAEKAQAILERNENRGKVVLQL